MLLLSFLYIPVAETTAQEAAGVQRDNKIPEPKVQVIRKTILNRKRDRGPTVAVSPSTYQSEGSPDATIDFPAGESVSTKQAFIEW